MNISKFKKIISAFLTITILFSLVSPVLAEDPPSETPVVTVVNSIEITKEGTSEPEVIEEATIEVGEMIVLNAVVKDADGQTMPDETVTWSVKNEDSTILSVDSISGEVRASVAGTEIVVATSNTDESINKTIEIKVEESGSVVTSIEITKEGTSEPEVIEEATIEVGEMIVLNAVVKDADGQTMPDETVTWSVKNEDSTILSVDSISGEVRASVAGTEIVVATSEKDSNVRKTIKIKVEEPALLASITTKIKIPFKHSAKGKDKKFPVYVLDSDDNPIKEAEIIYYKDGNINSSTSTKIKTDENGKAYITINEEGIYYVTAERIDIISPDPVKIEIKEKNTNLEFAQDYPKNSDISYNSITYIYKTNHSGNLYYVLVDDKRAIGKNISIDTTEDLLSFNSTYYGDIAIMYRIEAVSDFNPNEEYIFSINKLASNTQYSLYLALMDNEGNISNMSERHFKTLANPEDDPAIKNKETLNYINSSKNKYELSMVLGKYADTINAKGTPELANYQGLSHERKLGVAQYVLENRSAEGYANLEEVKNKLNQAVSDQKLIADSLKQINDASNPEQMLIAIKEARKHAIDTNLDCYSKIDRFLVNTIISVWDNLAEDKQLTVAQYVLTNRNKDKGYSGGTEFKNTFMKALFSVKFTVTSNLKSNKVGDLNVNISEVTSIPEDINLKFAIESKNLANKKIKYKIKDEELSFRTNNKGIGYSEEFRLSSLTDLKNPEGLDITYRLSLPGGVNNIELSIGQVNTDGTYSKLVSDNFSIRVKSPHINTGGRTRHMPSVHSRQNNDNQIEEVKFIVPESQLKIERQIGISTKEDAKVLENDVKKIVQMLAKAKSKNKVTLEVPYKSNSTVETKMPADILKKLKEAKVSNLVVQTGIVDLNIPTDAIKDMPQGDEITLSAAKLKPSDVPAAKKAGVPEGTLIVDLDLMVGKEKVSKFAKPLEITIPYEGKVAKGETVTVYFLKDDGTVEAMKTEYDNKTKTVSFTTNHFSKYFATAKELPKLLEVNFTDIANHWAKDEITFLAERGIIEGKSDTKFAPENNITRAEFATLIARMLDLEADANTKLPFTDVSENAWYYESVLAVYDNGLIEGKTPTTFDPKGNITKEEIAKIIGKVLSKEGYEKANLTELDIFKDKSLIANWAKEEVALIVEAGITEGLEEGKDRVFQPKVDATRAQTAKMLYELYMLIVK